MSCNIVHGTQRILYLTINWTCDSNHLVGPNASTSCLCGKVKLHTFDLALALNTLKVTSPPNLLSLFFDQYQDETSIRGCLIIRDWESKYLNMLASENMLAAISVYVGGTTPSPLHNHSCHAAKTEQKHKTLLPSLTCYFATWIEQRNTNMRCPKHLSPRLTN